MTNRYAAGLVVLLVGGCATNGAPLETPVVPTVSNSPPASPTKIQFRGCRERGAMQAGMWEGAVMSFIGITAGTSTAFRGASVEFAPCAAPPATCYADAESGIVTCRGAVLERLAKSVGYLAATYADAGSRDYQNLAGDDQQGPAMDAFRYSWDGQGPAETLERVERLRATTLTDLLTPGASTPGIDLYAMIGTLVFQFLIGHESTHANHETCAVAEAAVVEQTGLFDKIVTLDSGNSLFCSNDLDVNEVRADRCALRQLKIAAARINDRAAGKANLAQLARRGAAALLSWYAYAGYAEQPTAPRVTSLIQKGYLRGPLRELVIGTELSAGLPGPAVCGESARLFTLGAQDHFIHCTKAGRSPGGDVPDWVLRQLPKGVETGWGSNQWTRDSFSCRPSAP